LDCGDRLDLDETREGERKEVGKITPEEEEEEEGEENGNLEQVEDEKCEEEEEDCSPRLATQLSLHEELRMSSSFANHSDNEDDPEVRVENVEEEDEAKDAGERGDDDEEGDGEQEEEEGDPMSLFLAHKPFCGRLTSSALSKAEEFSETETYSSGFSEDYKMTLFKPVHRHTQTCDRELADISNPVNDLDSHFQTTPRYKVIFKEIFQVLKQANKADVASRRDGRIKHVVWQGSNSSLGKTSNCPEEANARLPSTEYQRDSLKSKALPTKEYQSLSFAPKTTFTDYSNLPPSSLSSMASMARLKQLQESYASVLRRGIQDV